MTPRNEDRRMTAPGRHAAMTRRRSGHARQRYITTQILHWRHYAMTMILLISAARGCQVCALRMRAAASISPRCRHHRPNRMPFDYDTTISATRFWPYATGKCSSRRRQYSGDRRNARAPPPHDQRYHQGTFSRLQKSARNFTMLLRIQYYITYLSQANTKCHALIIDI